MQPRPKYQVFISSTYGDLRDEREAVTWAILSARHIPAGMENFTATDDRGWETIKSVIDRSDYYVLILAGRYGSVYRRGKSWTEKEYEYAVLRNIPVLAFIRAKRSIRADAMDEDSALRAKLEGFKRKVRDRHLCREWDERADLVAEVSNALSNHIRDDEQGGRQRPGWYRGDELSSLQNFDFAEPVEGFIAEAIQLDNTGPVYCYAFSLDSRLALTGGRDKAVRLWDLETRRCVRLFEGHGKAVECISWSADQRCVLSASDDRTVRRWDVKTGRCLSVLDGHTGDVWSVAWSPDQRYACSGSGDHTVRLWDLEAGTCVSILEGHKDYVSSTEWSPDQSWVLSGSEDCSVRLWDVEKKQCLRVFEGHDSPVYCAKWSPDQSRVLSSSDDGSVRLWDVETGQCLRIFEGHTTYVVSVAWANDGRHFLSGAEDGSVRLWDVETRECLRIFEGHTADVRCVEWGADQHHAISGDAKGRIRRWDLTEATK